jgi:hypothetical protein
MPTLLMTVSITVNIQPLTSTALRIRSRVSHTLPLQQNGDHLIGSKAFRTMRNYRSQSCFITPYDVRRARRRSIRWIMVR